ncbi:alpha/beta fold hydrolase [Shimia ponticola]|uniref:alpha/beta fold hydrolase n=1 Tax=Shimia ponticola TaxID=2582893 RepID=UPI00164BB876|nr:alpha/beta hydrolase [Shimia ponticola]
MNMLPGRRSHLTETVQSGLPTWTERSGEALILDAELHSCDRFYYRAFGDCDVPVNLYSVDGQRLVETLTQDGQTAFPERFEAWPSEANGPLFLTEGGELFFLYGKLDQWPSAPSAVAWVCVHISPAWFKEQTDTALTTSEFVLLSHLLAGHDLRAAAQMIGASYDTKRKQLQQITEKLGVSTQAALLREVSLQISASVLEDILKPEVRNPEVSLAQELYGRDIVIHSITVGDAREVPIWEFGARRGQPVLYFHSMLAPMVFKPDMVDALKQRNLRMLMMPRHFFAARNREGSPQMQVLSALSDVVDYLCGEPVVCIGESAGCAWATHFARFFPERVSEVVLVATPQAAQPEAMLRKTPRTATVFAEVSSRIRNDARVVAGLTRIYNSIARVPSLARRSLDFMLRQAPSDQETIEQAFESLRLADWLRLIANDAARASIDEVAHLQSDWVRDVFEMDCPARFIHGGQDTLCPIEDAAAMAAAVPGASFRRFDGCGHLVLGQEFDAILDEVFPAAA